MGSAVPQSVSFADVQESRFEAWNNSYMSNAILQGGRFADILEFCFDTVKHSDTRCAVL